MPDFRPPAPRTGERCGTRYPIVLVHGAGFRDDYRLFGYWGRLPAALRREGATLFTSGQDAWGSVDENARRVQVRVQEVLARTGAAKVNLVAHSKGGLESRHLISALGMGPAVASLTTISTPHHGSRTIDLLLKLPNFLLHVIAFFVNLWFRLLGDARPDFATACRQLSRTGCERFNAETPDDPDVYYQSYAARMKGWLADVLFFWTWPIIHLVEGANDGLCPVESARWAEYRGEITGRSWRGVSHADVVDMRRYDPGTDIREVYVAIVEDLKDRGL
jgi:triacylglycerol lipase